LQSYFDVN